MAHLVPGVCLQHRYVLERSLGQGAAAHAFVATDLLRSRTVALKAIVDPKSLDPTSLEPKSLEPRLRNEFLTLCGLSHPHLARVHDFGVAWLEDESIAFYTADVAAGVDFAYFCQGKSWQDVLRPAGHVLSALGQLHVLGVRHGDVKADNVIVDETGLAVLIDLSCAAALTETATSPSGTPSHWAPEVTSGTPIDARADLYAFGVMLQRLSELLREPLPSRVGKVLSALVHASPAKRPASAWEAAEALGATEVPRWMPSGDAPCCIGRTDLRHRFDTVLSSLLEATPDVRALCVRGASGMGKTRLLREFAWQAQVRCEVASTHGRTRSPVSALLNRVLRTHRGTSPLEGWHLLRRRQRPLVLVLDDVHKLSEPERWLLDACLRSLHPTDHVLWVLSAEPAAEPAAEPSAEVHSVEDWLLEPLGLRDLDLWTGKRLAARELRQLERASGGCPSIVRVLSADLMAGRLAAGPLEELPPAHFASLRMDRDFARLSETSRRGLAAMAILRSSLDDSWIADLQLDADDLVALERDLWVTLESDGWRLARTVEASAILTTLNAALVSSVRVKVIAGLERRLADLDQDAPSRPEVAAHWVEQWLEAGDQEAAEAAFLEQHPDEHPAAWRRCASKIVVRTQSDEIRWRHVRILRLTDGPQAALPHLARWLSKGPPRRWQHQAWCEAARACLRLAQFDRVQRQLARAQSVVFDIDDHARISDIRARTFFQLGSYEPARDLAREALTSVRGPRLRAALLETAGLASSYLGETAAADDDFACASELRQQVGPAAALAKLRSYQAVHAYRSARLDQAAIRYEQALLLAEQHGSRDMIASTALNLATVHHQAGAWGRAFSAYERAGTLASAMGKTSTGATVRWNQAKLYADLGALDHAERLLVSVSKDAQLTGVQELAAVVASLEGEIALARNDFARAAAHFAIASSQYQALGTERDYAEAELQRAEVDLISLKLDPAQQRCDALRLTISRLNADDLSVRLALLDARLAIEQDDAARALPVLERALDAANRCGMLHLQAEVLEQLAAAWLAQGGEVLASEHLARARAAWERVAASLPPALRDAFWTHPRRRGLAKPKSNAQPSEVTLPAPVRRLLAINRRLSSSLDMQQVLSATMDAAVELSGAERGLLLVVDEAGKLEVASAHNLEPTRVNASQLEFSHGIAEGVLKSGEPILTVDALCDDRFRQNESVHAMQLRSVVCVPIRSPSRTQGALYLDHRFHPGCFRKGDVDLLVAFADQVGIALQNARLHAKVERQATELVARQAQIEVLLGEQADEIDRLQEQVRLGESSLGRAYGEIVGQSPTMRGVFALLDRVVEATVPVVISGESGTGKELVARAVHQQGLRRQGPFVSVNCAALQDPLLESELFGHVRGAFTGAVRQRVGLFVAARGGTLFLDEVGEMSPAMQVKLLRVLQEREVRPVGSNSSVPVDVRLVCATNRQLRQDVESGRFREDLFYRIAVIEVALPPLRERVEDIAPLAQHLLTRAAQEHGTRPVSLTPQAFRKLLRYKWPGNVRQLENTLVKAMLLTEGQRIRAEDIDLPVPAPKSRPVVSREDHERNERDRMVSALNDHAWNASEAARALGIPRTSFYRKLHKYGVQRRRG